jgi:hypothetical protein
MGLIRLEQEGKQIILHTEGAVCATRREVIESSIFQSVVDLYFARLHAQDSPLLEAFPKRWIEANRSDGVVHLLRALAEDSLEQVSQLIPDGSHFLESHPRRRLHEFLMGLYDFWRSHDRFMVLHLDVSSGERGGHTHHAFGNTIETLNAQVRAVFRDMRERVMGHSPHVYRQLAAGCNIGVIASPKQSSLPAEYESVLGGIDLIRVLWMAPPLMLDPPTNKRGGGFAKVNESLLRGMVLSKEKWLCYPARVGPLVIFIYYHHSFMGLGCSLANLFDVATEQQSSSGPDAICLFGAPPASLERYGETPVVFHDDEKNGLVVGVVPAGDRWAYFGYLKKMTLVLHNVVMMKRGRMPFHGALVHLGLKGGASANILLIGDSGTGKSETLEALRLLGQEQIRDLRVIADDMGSLEVTSDGRVLGYGTETGAFVRLDDLEDGYAFRQLDRAIFMSPQKVNARVVLPVTTIDDVLCGHPVDFLLYVNNYEEVDEQHPILERFTAPEPALDAFRQGTAMAKGTTTATGLVHNYFSNIFGPPAYRELHDSLAMKTFAAAFRAGAYVGQVRTRLGIPGCERDGPGAAAGQLFKMVAKDRR